MPKSKKLWNTSGVLKSYTDAKGAYHAVEAWTGPKTGMIKAMAEDVERLKANGFTDRDPNPKPEKKAPAPKPPAEEGG